MSHSFVQRLERLDKETMIVYLVTSVDENDAVVSVFSTPAKAFDHVREDLDQVTDEHGKVIADWDGQFELDIHPGPCRDRVYQLTPAAVE